MTDYDELLKTIIARETSTPWAEYESILAAIKDDSEMNRRMADEWKRIPVLSQEEINKYYATSKTWLMQTYVNGKKALLGLARKDPFIHPPWAKEFLKLLLPQRGAHILDYGGGFLNDSWFLRHLGHWVTLAEIDGPVTEVVKEFLHAIREDDVFVLPVGEGPVQFGRYDGALCFETLEHVKDPVGLAARIVATLPPGGPFLLSVSFGAPAHAPYHLAEHVRFGDPCVWGAELAKMGLERVWGDASNVQLWKKRP